MRALLVPCTLCDILRWCPKGDKALCLFVQEVLSAYFTFISVSIRHLQSVNSSHSIGESSKQTIRMLCGKNTNSILPWKLQELGGGARVALVKQYLMTTSGDPDSNLDQTWWVSTDCVACDVRSGVGLVELEG